MIISDAANVQSVTCTDGREVVHFQDLNNSISVTLDTERPRTNLHPVSVPVIDSSKTYQIEITEVPDP
jgi:hypothetical protein